MAALHGTPNAGGGSHKGERSEVRPADAEWQVLGRRTVYDSKWIRLEMAEVQLPSGQHFEHHTVTMPPAAMAVVFDDVGSHVLLSWRHRFVPAIWNYELPGGLIEPGEEPEATIVREVAEETGFQLQEVQPLVTFEPMVGMVSSRHHVFVGRAAGKRSAPTELDEGAFEWVKLTDVPALIAEGKVCNSGSLVGLLHVLAFDRLSDPR